MFFFRLVGHNFHSIALIKANYIEMTAYSIIIIFYSSVFSSSFLGKWIDSTHDSDSRLFSGIGSIQLMIQWVFFLIFVRISWFNSNRKPLNSNQPVNQLWVIPMSADCRSITLHQRQASYPDLQSPVTCGRPLSVGRRPPFLPCRGIYYTGLRRLVLAARASLCRLQGSPRDPPCGCRHLCHPAASSPPPVDPAGLSRRWVEMFCPPRLWSVGWSYRGWVSNLGLLIKVYHLPRCELLVWFYHALYPWKQIGMFHFSKIFSPWQPKFRNYNGWSKNKVVTLLSFCVLKDAPW